VTESEPTPAPLDSWEAILEAMRRRFPGQRDSVLFCIHKLQQNPDLTLRDFRAEAELYGIPMAGRALHSARVLLGIGDASPAPARARTKVAAESPSETTDGAGSIENRVVAAVRQIQSAAGAEAERMRAAIQKAITILQQAIDE